MPLARTDWRIVMKTIVSKRRWRPWAMQPLLAVTWCVCDAPLLAAVRKHPLVQDVKAIVKAFKFKHLTLRTDAVKALQSVLRRCALLRTRPLFDAVTRTI